MVVEEETQARLLLRVLNEQTPVSKHNEAGTRKRLQLYDCRVTRAHLQDVVLTCRILCSPAGCCAHLQDVVLTRRMLCSPAGCCAHPQDVVLTRRMSCSPTGCRAQLQDVVLTRRMSCSPAGCRARPQDVVLTCRMLSSASRCSVLSARTMRRACSSTCARRRSPSR